MTEVFAEAFTVSFVYAAVVFAVAGVMHGYTGGFGSGLFAVPLLALLFGPVGGIAVGSLTSLLGSAQLVPAAMRLVSWRHMVPLMIAQMVMVPLGAALLVSMDPTLVRRVIGVLVLLSGILLATGWTYHGRRGPLMRVTAGGIAGFMGGIAGITGPVLVAYFLSAPEQPELQRARIVLAVFAGLIVVQVSLLVAGGAGAVSITRSLALAPLFMATTWFGTRLFARAPITWFRKVSLVMLFGSGAAALLI
jgi:uncharacterized membrane protein YfcA